MTGGAINGSAEVRRIAQELGLENENHCSKLPNIGAALGACIFAAYVIAFKS